MYGGFVKYSSFRAPTEEQLRDTLIDSLRNDSNTRRVTALCDTVCKVYSSESNVSCMELQLHDFSLPMILAGINYLGIDECCLLTLQRTSQPQDKTRPQNWQAGGGAPRQSKPGTQTAERLCSATGPVSSQVPP